MTKLTISFYGREIDRRGNYSFEALVDTETPNSFHKTFNDVVCIGPASNSPLATGQRHGYDQTFVYVVQQEGNSLAVAAAMYTKMGDTRGGMPADVKIVLEEAASVDEANAEKLVDLLHSMATAYEAEFIRDGLLQSSRNGSFDLVCARILKEHALQIGNIKCRNVSTDPTHRLAKTAPVIYGQDGYKTARRLPNAYANAADYQRALRNLAVQTLIDFERTSGPPAVLASEANAALLSERLAIVDIAPAVATLFSPAKAALQVPSKPEPEPAPAAPQLVAEKAAPIAETFTAAKAELTADERYAKVMEHITALAIASKDRGPDGEAARKALTKITGHFAVAIDVYKNNGPGK